MSKEELVNIHEDVFNMITNCIIGKYVLSDIGAKYYMNYGLRSGFGPVLLDFPYVFELDGNKMYCNKILDNGHHCGGEIDYDEGFNELICTSCGKKYLALELAKNNSDIIIIKGEDNMNIKIMRGNDVVKVISKSNEDDFIKVPETPEIQPQQKDVKIFKASLEIGEQTPERVGPEFNTKIVAKRVKGKPSNKKNNNRSTTVKAEIQNFDKKNKNNRSYDKKATEEAIKNYNDKEYKLPDFKYIHKMRSEGRSMNSLHKEYVESYDKYDLTYGITKFKELYRDYVKGLEQNNQDTTAEEENVNSVLEAYGLSDSDFDEPEDEIDSNHDLYAEYEKKYADQPNYEKRPKGNKKKIENF